MVNVTPPSVERNTADGSTPAHTSPGWTPGVICQTRFNVVPVRSGNLMASSGTLCQLWPRSSECSTRVP